MVIQFNVRSTNKSPYNAVYLFSIFDGESFGIECDLVADDRFQEHLIDYLPYAPHQERHNGKTETARRKRSTGTPRAAMINPDPVWAGCSIHRFRRWRAGSRWT